MSTFTLHNETQVSHLVKKHDINKEEGKSRKNSDRLGYEVGVLTQDR